MTKLKLQLDVLRVESFPTAQTEAAHGTVHPRTRCQVTCQVDCWA